MMQFYNVIKIQGVVTLPYRLTVLPPEYATKLAAWPGNNTSMQGKDRYSPLLTISKDKNYHRMFSHVPPARNRSNISTSLPKLNNTA